MWRVSWRTPNGTGDETQFLQENKAREFFEQALFAHIPEVDIRPPVKLLRRVEGKWVTVECSYNLPRGGDKCTNLPGPPRR